MCLCFVSGGLQEGVWDQCRAEGRVAGCQCDQDQQSAAQIANLALCFCEFESTTACFLIFLNGCDSLFLYRCIMSEASFSYSTPVHQNENPTFLLCVNLFIFFGMYITVQARNEEGLNLFFNLLKQSCKAWVWVSAVGNRAISDEGIEWIQWSSSSATAGRVTHHCSLCGFMFWVACQCGFSYVAHPVVYLFLSFQKCDEIIVLHLGYLNYTQYQVLVNFKGIENITYDMKLKFVVS